MKITKQEFEFESGDDEKPKKILDILRSKLALIFELSISVYFDSSSEPKTYFLRGERHADGGWVIHNPGGRNPSPLQSSEILKAKLVNIEEQVHEYIAKNAMDEFWKEMRVSLDKELKLGLSVEEIVYRSAAPILALDGRGYHAHFFAPAIAIAYAITGAEALENNDMNHASHCVDRALYWVRSDVLISNPNDRFIERAGTGGEGKNRRREPIKDMVAELLINLAPATGWESTSTAIDAVSRELTFEHSSLVEKCLLRTEALPRTIRGWVQTDPERFMHSIKSQI